LLTELKMLKWQMNLKMECHSETGIEKCSNSKG
jgi:hypothetical protein